MRKIILGAAVFSIGLYFVFRSSKSEAQTVTAPEKTSAENNLNDLLNFDINSFLNITPDATKGSSMTISVENKNPLNIRESSDNWIGLTVPRAKKGFFNFTDEAYCYRAAKQIILNAYAKRGVNTLRAIISTWAPATENNTENYINFVSKNSGIAKDAKINSENIGAMLRWMAKVESGKSANLDALARGLSL